LACNASQWTYYNVFAVKIIMMKQIEMKRTVVLVILILTSFRGLVLPVRKAIQVQLVRISMA
jgi:hypothetical protein